MFRITYRVILDNSLGIALVIAAAIFAMILFPEFWYALAP